MSYLIHWIAVLLLPLPLAKSVKITEGDREWSVSIEKYELLFESTATCADKETSGLLYVSFN